MPKTKRGIYHNLKESKYTITNDVIVFFFSSQLYMDKFLNEYKEHRQMFLSKKQKVDIENPLSDVVLIADITLYMLIEKRGFRAWIKGVDKTCEEMFQYALQEKTEKNTNDWSIMQSLKLEERIKIME